MEKAYIDNTLSLSLLMFMCIVKYVKIRLHGGKYKLYGQTRGKPNKKPKQTKQTNKQGYPSPTIFKTFIEYLFYVAIQMYHSIHNIYSFVIFFYTSVNFFGGGGVENPDTLHIIKILQET